MPGRSSAASAGSNQCCRWYLAPATNAARRSFEAAPQHGDRHAFDLQRATARRPRLDGLASPPALPHPVHGLSQRQPLAIVPGSLPEPSLDLCRVVRHAARSSLPAAVSQILGESLRLCAQLLRSSQLLEQGAAGAARHQVRGHAREAGVGHLGEIAVDLQRRLGAAGLAEVAGEPQLGASLHSRVARRGQVAQDGNGSIVGAVRVLERLGCAKHFRGRLAQGWHRRIEEEAPLRPGLQP